MDLASKKTRTIERKLKNVEALPVASETEFYNTDFTNTIYGLDEPAQEEE